MRRDMRALPRPASPVVRIARPYGFNVDPPPLSARDINIKYSCIHTESTRKHARKKHSSTSTYAYTRVQVQTSTQATTSLDVDSDLLPLELTQEQPLDG